MSMMESSKKVRSSGRLLCFIIFVVILCELFSCGPNKVAFEKNEDIIAIGQYLARFKDGKRFTLTGLEKAEIDDDIVYYNISGTSIHSDGEIVNVALILEYNRSFQIIDLHFWEDFEIGIGLDTKQKWEECSQKENGVKHYSDEEVVEMREKAEEYAAFIKSLED